MAREDLHFRLRIPEHLKLRIEEAAAENNRSMTAEIVDRLETSFTPLPAEVRSMISEFTRQLISALETQKSKR